MMDDMHEKEEEANTSTNAPRRRRCLTPDRQALADSIMKSVTASVTASVSKLRSRVLPTIYMVPQTIRQVNEVAYEPKIVSIGPYHHGKKSLQGMEEKKLLYLHSLLFRNPNHRLEDYLKAMEDLEDEAGSCYFDNIDPQEGKEFVKMMVLDACFIVEIFLRFYPIEHTLVLLRQQWDKLERKKEDLGLISAMQEFFFHSNGFEDPILDTIGMVYPIGYDMLLLENQIPFIVLQRIFIMACPVDVPHLLAEMALDFFDQFMPRNKHIQIKKIENNASCAYYHLLHLFHSHLLPTTTNSKKEPNLSCIPKIKLKPNLSCIPKIKLKPNLSCNPKIKSVLNKLKNLLIHFLPCSNEAPLPITGRREVIPCATDFQLAGFKFKKNKKSNSILNVKFSHGVLEITPFVIDDHSDTLFRNLVAFEQCYPEVNDYFTTYIVFMDCLVNTSEDVALLRQNGIIANLLGGDDEVARLFNRLCIGIFHNFNASYLSDVKDNVQKHCKSKWNMWQNKWNMWLASLKRDYFSNPWSVISLIAASILLLLTITQTFFTIFPYHGPRS